MWNVPLMKGIPTTKLYAIRENGMRIIAEMLFVQRVVFCPGCNWGQGCQGVYDFSKEREHWMEWNGRNILHSHLYSPLAVLCGDASNALARCGERISVGIYI